MSQCISPAEQKHHHSSSPDAAAQSNDAIALATITQRYSPFCEYAACIRLSQLWYVVWSAGEAGLERLRCRLSVQLSSAAANTENLKNEKGSCLHHS